MATLIKLIIFTTAFFSVLILFQSLSLEALQGFKKNPSGPNQILDKEYIEEIKKEVITSIPLKFDKNSTSSFLTVKGVIDQTNQQRINNGLISLKENNLLNESSQAKLQDLFDKQYFEHVSPTGESVDDFVKISNYEYILIGENLALGNFSDDKSLVQAWMDSPGHRANILNSRYREIGVAVGKGIFEGKSTWISVQHFGKPLSDCSLPNDAIKLRIDNLKNQLASLQEQLNKKRSELDNYQDKSSNEYRQEVLEYNFLVEKYNNLVIEQKDAIENYNNQIRKFNNCASI